MSHAPACVGSVEDLRDLNREPTLVAIDDEKPVAVVRHLKDDRADIEKAAMPLILAVTIIAIDPVGVDVHETDPGGRAAQAHLDDGAAGAGPEIPVEVLHSLFVAGLRVWRYARGGAGGAGSDGGVRRAGGDSREVPAG